MLSLSPPCEVNLIQNLGVFLLIFLLFSFLEHKEEDKRGSAEAEDENAVGRGAERDRVAASLRSAGWEVPDTQANFVWIVTADALDLTARLDRHGLTVRPFPGEGVRMWCAVLPLCQFLL